MNATQSGIPAKRASAPATATEALELARAALRSSPGNPRLLLQTGQCLLAVGLSVRACEFAEAAQRLAGADAVLLDAIGNLFSRAGDQVRALAAFEQAIALAPDQAHFLFNRATVKRFLGELAGAEADYDRVLRLRPNDFDAYLNRSELRRQDPQRNHVAELESLLTRGVASWRGEVAIRYALAKEYEDLRQFERSFGQLSRAAQLRRDHLHYDVGIDVATVEWIMEAHRGVWPAIALDSNAESSCTADAPIFIVGMPRSGSTLVERILGCHSAVTSGGELPHFALSVVAAVGTLVGPTRGPIARRELVELSAQVDFDALGRDYLRRVRESGLPEQRFTDKMPLNYLYCGLIRRALPKARIIHVTRHPLAACYAMFKTLFQDGYPFSYVLEELGRYYIAYRRLMDHWTEKLPGCIHVLNYEALIANQRDETERLLDFCGLEWQETCMEFHRNATPSTTRSAAQVRQPLYDSSVEQWRSYARELEPLRRQLKQAGLDV